MSAGNLSALIIALREGIEMTLIAGIVLAYLTQIGAGRAHRWVWLGIGAAAAVSVAFLGILNVLNAEFQGTTEQLFEGVTMLVAAGFLTWMIFWMLRQSRYLKGELHRAVQETLATGGAAWGIFISSSSPSCAKASRRPSFSLRRPVRANCWGASSAWPSPSASAS